MFTIVPTQPTIHAGVCSAFTRPCSRYNHTKVGATNSVNLLFPFERLLLRTNLSHKSKAASSVYRQDQPLNCRKSPNIVYIHIYIYVCIISFKVPLFARSKGMRLSLRIRFTCLWRILACVWCCYVIVYYILYLLQATATQELS